MPCSLHERKGGRGASLVDVRTGAHRWSRSAIGLWELLVRVLDVPHYIWPSAVADRSPRCATTPASSPDHTWVTLSEVIAGLRHRGGRRARARHPAAPLARWCGGPLYPILIASPEHADRRARAGASCSCSGSASGRSSPSSRSSASSRSSSARSTDSRSVDREYVRMMLTLDASRMVDLPARRVPVGAAADLHRDAHRRHLCGDRRRVRRVGRLRDRASAGRCSRPRADSTPRSSSPTIVFVTAMALALFVLVCLVERLTIPWARQQEAR